MPYVKDAYLDYVVQGTIDLLYAGSHGCYSALLHRSVLGASETAELRLRLSDRSPKDLAQPFAEFDAILSERLEEADEFYASITPPNATEDEARVLRQSLAGMLWSKQFYFYDVDKW